MVEKKLRTLIERKRHVDTFRSKRMFCSLYSRTELNPFREISCEKGSIAEKVQSEHTIVTLTRTKTAFLQPNIVFARKAGPDPCKV